MEINKNVYYDAKVGETECELAVRSDFKGDYNSVDFCICQIREREEGKTTTRYKTLTLKELRLALGLSQKAKLTIRG